MSGSIPGRIRGIAILAGVLCGVGIGAGSHAETEQIPASEVVDSWSETIVCSVPAEPPVSWPGLIREIRETPVIQIEDGDPPLTFNTHDIEEIIRVVPTVELPSDRR
jgi:hypothetical protein